MYTLIVGNFLLEGYANGYIYVRRPGQGSPEPEIASPTGDADGAGQRRSGGDQNDSVLTFGHLDQITTPER
jgi:hypothetical protein